MEIEAIYEPYIYSIKYDGQDKNAFYLLFDAWNDITEVVEFMRTHQEYLKNPIWGDECTPESAAGKVRDEARELARIFIDLFEKTDRGENGGIKLADTIQNSPDLKDHVIKNIDKVRTWLIQNGIIDEQDFNE